MQIVVPMAGAGQRFRDAGYALPKPLIPIGGVPMVVRAVRDLPVASRVVFVCHPAHVAEHRVDALLREWFPGCRVVVTPGMTEGQACSVRLAAPELDPEEAVLVAACDNTHVYSAERFAALTADSSLDALVWTYRGDPRVLVRPQWYGWVRTRGDFEVAEVSVKVPISADPLADHVVSGTFWFRFAGLMLRGIDELVWTNERVNNEFYLDSVPNVLLRRGCRVGVFEADKYIGWGTPDDVRSYCQWERYFGGQSRAA